MAYATSTYITLALLAASTATTIYTQQAQAKSQEQAANYNNALAQRDAALREREAAEASQRQRIENRRHLARIRLSLANSGTLTTTGTPLAIIGETAGNLELGIRDAKRRTDMESAAMRQQGIMGLWEASQAQSAANLSSIATGLKGLSSAGSAYSGAVYQGQLPDTFNLYRAPSNRRG